MNNIYLYLSSRIAGNSLSAVDLAKNNPTKSNFSFAKKLLAIKMKITAMKIQKNNGDSIFYKQKESKYEMLFQRLEAIKKINKYQKKYDYYDSPGDKFKIMYEEICMRIKESDVSLTKEKLNELISINKKIERCNDYRNIHIDANDLRSFYLKNRDLSNMKFKVSTKDFDIKNVNIDFSNSCLKGVDLSDVSIDGAIYRGADLANAKIKISVGKYLTDFSNAKLDGATMHFSDSEFLNSHLNEDLYENTSFDIIKTISDKYKGIKVSLVKDIIKKINVAEMTDKVPIGSIIKNLIGMSFCMEDETISNFIKQLFEVKCANKQEKDFDFHMKDKYIMTYLNLLSDFYNVQELKNFMLNRNGGFIKLMTLSLYHDDEKIREKARVLYNRYLELDEVKPFVGKTNFSNGCYRVNWKSKEYNNYILVSENNAMIINHKNITKMLFNKYMECDVKWNKYFYYYDGKYKKNDYSDNDFLFNKTFKIFRNNYNMSVNKIKIDKFLSLINLGNYQKYFQSKWMGIPTSFQEDFLDTKKYKDISIIFENLLLIHDNKKENISLKPGHYKSICNVFELTSLDNKEKSKYLLSLAILFIDFVYEFVFDVYKKEYYQPILNYVCALINKANELNIELMGSKYPKWIDSFSEYDMEKYSKIKDTLLKMKKHANKYFESIYQKIIPLHWQSTKDKYLS
ncbi:hypothetical protein [Proteus terrae]|uniref:hypothetical protein n=1 Tax=Proteus terrae TaxID=1574161 RepID=UPI00301DD40F